MADIMSEWNAYVAAHGQPRRIELLLCDLNAVLRGKWLPGDQIEKLANGEVRLPLSTYAPNILGEEVEATGLGIVEGDPDGVIVPIPGTLRPVPWAEDVAQVQVEMAVNGAISPISSREILRSVLMHFTAQGWRPVVASELEFYILKPRESRSDAPEPPARTPAAQNYDMELLDRTTPILEDIQAAAEAQGLPTDTLIAEYGPGQFEINFHHTDDVLAAADTALMFRRLVRGVVARHGMEATFAAKPYADHPGNGMHMHVSVLDKAGSNIFSADSGVGEQLRHAVAGTLATMHDLQAIFAPHMNSYRRFGPASFAPSAPDWALDHRGAAVRIPETSGPAARLEHRISGADVNPYLVMAAVLGGMFHGLMAKPRLPLPLDDAKAAPTEPLNHDWQGAVTQFANSQIAQKIFGTEFRDLYATVRQDEIDQISREISPIEYRTYLSRF